MEAKMSIKGHKLQRSKDFSFRTPHHPRLCWLQGVLLFPAPTDSRGNHVSIASQHMHYQPSSITSESGYYGPMSVSFPKLGRGSGRTINRQRIRAARRVSPCWQHHLLRMLEARRLNKSWSRACCNSRFCGIWNLRLPRGGGV